MENERTKGFQRKSIVILWLILFWPLGLAALTVNKTFRKGTRITLFIIFGLLGSLCMNGMLFTVLEFREGNIIGDFLASHSAPSETMVDFPRIEPGQSLDGVILLDQDSFQSFLIEVPETALGIRIAITKAAANLDIFLYHEEGGYNSRQADFSAQGNEAREELYLYNIYNTWFPPGEYKLEVAYRIAIRPRKNGEWFDEIPFTVKYEIFDSPDMLVDLVPGTPVQAVTNHETGFLAHFALDVPSGTEAFRFDVLDTPADVDLFLAREEPNPRRRDYLVIADSFRGRESIVLSDLPEEGGRYYLTVLGTKNMLESQDIRYASFPFQLLATMDSAPPEQAPRPPILPKAEEGFDAARLATVQLLAPHNQAGTGCLVSPDGLILTNYHVVSDKASETFEVVVGLSLGTYERAEELFTGKVIRSNPEDDMALVRITGDRWGRPLPEGYRFPAWPMGEPRSLSPGDPLMILGYSLVGAGPTRSYYTLTKGIFSGKEELKEGFFHYKTDTIMASGNSGGPVCDTGWNLHGLSTTYRSDGGGLLTWFIPVDAVPQEWRQLMK